MKLAELLQCVGKMISNIYRHHDDKGTLEVFVCDVTSPASPDWSRGARMMSDDSFRRKAHPCVVGGERYDTTITGIAKSWSSSTGLVWVL